jgi:gas vesicle protein
MAKTGKFFLAGLLAATAGAVGGLLLAPQSGKKTREDIKKILTKLSKEVQSGVKDTKDKVKEVFGDVSDEAVAKYKKIKTAVMEKVAEVKTAGKEIDKSKYAMIVEDVVEEYKSDLKSTKDGARKLIDQLKKDWNKVKKVLA